jgi:hypothetical protein
MLLQAAHTHTHTHTHTPDDVKTVLLVVAGQITKWTVLVEDLG